MQCGSPARQAQPPAGIRLNPTTTQNVVTYTVVVEAPNPGRKLLPGMTANLSFRIDQREHVVKVPNAALRFLPTKLEQVRPEDRDIFEGNEKAKVSDEEKAQAQSDRSATERALANRGRTRRHVWVEEGDYLRAVEVQTGINDNQFTELVSGELKPGDKLVTGIAPPKP